MAIRDISLQTRLWMQTLLDHLHPWRVLPQGMREKRRGLELTALEERVLLSASPAGAIVPDSAAFVAPAPMPEGEAPTASGDIDPLLAALEVDQAEQPNSSHELVLIDAGVRGVELLVNDLALSPEMNRTRDIIQLDADRNGVEQISEILANYQNLDAVHVVSHGRDGAVKLGNFWLDAQGLEANSDAISQWQLAFTDGGDFVFYGCDLAATATGQDFVTSLAARTGTDIAASGDATGSPHLGGDWDLEFRVGPVETDLAFSQTAQQNYNQLLATLTVGTTGDVLDGDTTSVSTLLANKGADGVISLREAIIASNNTIGADDIFLSAGTYTLALGTGDNDALLGDLDIFDDVTITGEDPGTTIIDGGGIDRVFHLRNNSTVVTMTGLTIRGGFSSNNGAGVFVDNASTLNLADVILTDNNGGDGDGGAFHVHGTLNLDRVLLTNNSAGKGGGIYFHNADGGTLINVTISGNTASSQGGGIWSETSLSITNSTITANHATVAGGVYHKNGTAVLTNTIIGGNTATDSSPDVKGNFSSAGFNLIEDTEGASGFVQSDIFGYSPHLNPLGDYGGSIPTHSLGSLSYAINSGTTTGAPSVDGRNIARDARPDIGAFERIAELVPTSEFRVNTTTTNTQVTTAANRGSHQAVAMSASGDYVVVWSSLNQDGDGWGIYGQRFNRTGTALGAEFLINETTAGNQQFASVAMNDYGEFLVAWADDQTGNIYSQAFKADGTRKSTTDLLNSTTTGSRTNPSVALNNNGLAVVVWEGNGPGDSSGIFGRRIHPHGYTLGTDFRINATTLGTQADAAVSMNNSGQFVVSWDDGANFYAQRFNADGSADGGEIRIQSALLAANGDGSIAIAEDGSFVATWIEDVLLFGKEIYVRRYDASGNALGAAELVNTTTSGTQTSPSISMDLDGDFLIVWEGDGSGDSYGVFGQKYDANGNAVGSEFLINETTAGTQELASVAMYDLDNFVVVWSGKGTGDTEGVFARQFGTASPNSSPIVNDATFTISESTAVGTSLGFVIASDPDIGDTLAYSVSGPMPGVFAIDAQTGELTLIHDSFLNFEFSPTFSITVRVFDKELLSDTATITINLTDANEEPTVNSASLSVDENSAPGTVAGTISASDPDTGDSYTLAIVGGDPGGSFELDATTGLLTLTSSAALDFETASQHALQIQATDAGGLQSVRTIEVQIQDVNEKPLLNDVSFDLADTVAHGTLVGGLNGLDADAGDSLMYEILAGNDDGVFSLDPATGKLQVADASGLDFDTMPQFLLTVKVMDAMGLTDTATVTINLVETQPNISNTTFTIDENSPAGATVGTVSATDPNGDTPFNYSLVQGNLDNVFAIDSQTGEIRVADAELLNHEYRSQYTLIVRVTNASGISGVGLVEITVNDVSEPPIALDDFYPALTRKFFFDHEDFTRNDIHPEGEKLIVVGFANLGDADIFDNGDQTYLYVLPKDAHLGIYTFTYFVQDVSGRIGSAQVTIDLLRNSHWVDSLSDLDLNDRIPAAHSEAQRSANPQPRPQVDLAPAPNRLGPSFRPQIPSDSEDDSSPQDLPLSNGVLFAPQPVGLNSLRNVRGVAPEAAPEPLPQVSPQNPTDFEFFQDHAPLTDSPGFTADWSDVRDAQANQGIPFHIPDVKALNSGSADPETTEWIVQEIGKGSLVWQDLDQMDEAIEAENTFQTLMVGTAVTVTSTLTLGYVLWMIRGGVLLGSVLTHLPTWRFLDPLPVLEHLADGEEAQDQESLESIIETARFA